MRGPQRARLEARRIRALALVALAIGAAGCEAGQAVPIGEGRSLYFSCSGVGSPTVVLEAGWAADHVAWAGVQPELAAVTRTCSYDRAGTGRSPPGPLPRTPAAVATDLLRALDSQGIAGNLVLVGHSIGAIHARQVELQAPARVVGLVLVDPTVEAMAGPGLSAFIASAEACLAAVSENRPLPAEGPLARCRVRPTEQPVPTWTHRVSELRDLFPAGPARSSADAIRPAPAIVLSAGQGADSPAGQWRILAHQALARRFAGGRHEIVPESGHMMMRDAPEAIVRATAELVLAARARGGGNAPGKAMGREDVPVRGKGKGPAD